MCNSMSLHNDSGSSAPPAPLRQTAARDFRTTMDVGWQSECKPQTRLSIGRIRITKGRALTFFVSSYAALQDEVDTSTLGKAQPTKTQLTTAVVPPWATENISMPRGEHHPARPGLLANTNYYTNRARCKHDVPSGPRGEEGNGPRILTRAAREARGDKRPG